MIERYTPELTDEQKATAEELAQRIFVELCNEEEEKEEGDFQPRLDKLLRCVPKTLRAECNRVAQSGAIDKSASRDFVMPRAVIAVALRNLADNYTNAPSVKKLVKDLHYFSKRSKEQW